MAKQINRQTSPAVAKKAGKLLKTSKDKDVKSVAATGVSQAAPKKAVPKKKK